MLDLKQGQAVEVHVIVMFGSPAEWRGGYTFGHYEDDKTAIVVIAAGEFAGVDVRYDIANIRPAS